MGRLDEMVRGVREVADSLDGLLRSAMEDNPAVELEMVEMQKEQLYAGKRSDGRDIAPTMDEDPFFRTRDAAMRYMLRKRQRFATNPFDAMRKFNVPNLILSTGLFHSGFYVDFGPDAVKMCNDQGVPNERGILVDVYSKYGQETFGLTDENWDLLMRRDVIPQLRERIMQKIS